MNGASSTGGTINWAQLATELQPLYPLLKYISIVMGIWIVMSNLIHLGGVHRRGYGYGAHIFAIFIGVLMVNISEVVDSVSQTMFQQPADSLLSYTPPAGMPDVDELKTLILIVHLVGFWAVFRGLREMSLVYLGEGEMEKGTWHIIGGVLAINIVTVMHAIAGAIGPEFGSVVTRLLG